MRRAERLYRLVDELRTRRVTRAAELAAVLEVSPRTVYRDIAHLQASGLPIAGEAGVGYLLSPGFDLPPVTFTHDQLEALAVGLAMAAIARWPPIARIETWLAGLPPWAALIAFVTTSALTPEPVSVAADAVISASRAATWRASSALRSDSGRAGCPAGGSSVR